MKKLIAVLLVVATGCSMWPAHQAAPTPAPATGTTNAVIVAPNTQFGVSGAKITRVNEKLKFVVLDFSGQVMPAIGSKLTVYRGVKKVGTVQITEPVRATFATADILDGTIRVGDEAR